MVPRAKPLPGSQLHDFRINSCDIATYCLLSKCLSQLVTKIGSSCMPLGGLAPLTHGLRKWFMASVLVGKLVKTLVKYQFISSGFEYRNAVSGLFLKLLLPAFLFRSLSPESVLHHIFQQFRDLFGFGKLPF